MGTLDLDELERLEKEATPGPWVAERDKCRCGSCPFGMIVTYNHLDNPGDRVSIVETVHDYDDATLIPALRNAAPELIRLARIGKRVESPGFATVELHKELQAESVSILDEKIGLHERLEVIFVVDGFLAQFVERDGCQTAFEAHGATVNEAIRNLEAAMRNKRGEDE